MNNPLDTEFSEKFVEYMKNRMEVSFYKYGPLKEAYPFKVDAIKSALTRIEKYKETGNGEFLVDAANFLMIETMSPAHKNYHFEATDSDKSPGRNWWHGPKNKKRNDE